MKKSSITFIALALIPAFLLVFRAVNGDRVPSDLRDAVADTGAAGQLGLSDEAEVPMPAAAAAEEGAGTGAFAAAGSSKGFEEIFNGNKRLSGGETPAEPSLLRLASDNGLAGKPPYEVLSGLFSKGAPAPERDLLGWRAGRSLLAEDQGKFMASLLCVERRAVNPDGGPLFAGDHETIVVSKLKQDEAADYYDRPTAEMVEFIKKEIRETRNDTKLNPSSGIASLTNESGTVKLEYRKVGGYIFERWSTQKKGEAFEVRGYAYFFKDVTPR